MRQKERIGFSGRNIFAFAIFIFALAGVAFAAPKAAAAEVLRIGSGCAYPPFIYKDASGVLKGFEVDIADEIARRLNMKTERQCVPFDGIITGLLGHRFDAVINAMDITAERAKKVNFSIPYYRAPAVFIGSKALNAEAPPGEVKLPAAFMQGKAVGALRSSVYEKYLLSVYPHILLTRYDNSDAMLIDLKAGRINMAFTDMPKAESDFLHKDGNGDFAIIGSEVKDYKLLGEGSAVALRKGDIILLNKINAALKNMMADGTYDKICKKYWSFSVRP